MIEDKKNNTQDISESVLNDFGDSLDQLELQGRLSQVRLKEIRESFGLSQKQFAQKFGIKESTYSRYESGDIKSMPLTLITDICRIGSLNPAWLIGYRNVDKYLNFDDVFHKTKKVPVLGSIAAGVPILTQEDIMGYEFVYNDDHVDFCLNVRGDSMIGARILDGDTVYIRQQPDVENGEIAAVLITDGGEANATLKRVYKVDGTIILRAENPSVPDMIFKKRAANAITILGKAISFKSGVR